MQNPTSSFESLKDLLTSAMPTKPVKTLNADGSNFLKSLTTGASPQPSIDSSSSSSSSSSSKIINSILPVCSFKQPIYEYDFPTQLVTASEDHIAYVVNRKKVRLLSQANGNKGMMDHQKSARGSIISIAFKGNTLASLTDEGELMIGNVYSQSKELLGYEPIVSLTFPDLAPSRKVTWNEGSRRILAISGTGQSVFIVWLDPKPMAIELPHSLTSVKTISFFNEGNSIAVSDSESIQCFSIEQETKNFTKIAQISFGPLNGCQRISIYDDNDNDFVVGAISDGNFFACALNIGKELKWIDSGLSLDKKRIDSLPIIYDKELSIFIIDGISTGGFGVLGFKSDYSGLVLVPGKWNEAAVAISLVIGQSQRNLSKGIHLPLYVLHPLGVSFYGLELPSPPTEEPAMSSSLLVKNAAEPSKVPLEPTTTATMNIESVVQKIMIEQLVPAIEASVNEMLRQIKDHFTADKNLEAKVDNLTVMVTDLKRSIDCLPSVGQIADALSPTLGSALNLESSEKAAETSLDDLVKAEIEDCLSKESTSAALTKALQLGNLKILNWLLEKLDPVNVVESTNEAVLLSLAQQLGTDLGESIEMKLDWLAEIFTTFKAPQSMESSLVAEVLEEIFASLRILFAELPSDSSLMKKVKVVMRLVRMAQSS